MAKSDKRGGLICAVPCGKSWQILKTDISAGYDKEAACKDGKDEQKALTKRGRCGNLTKLSARDSDPVEIPTTKNIEKR